MKIVHVYNNNIISAMKDKQEIIIIGVGIGFNKRSNDIVDETKIEKIYKFENQQRRQLNQLMERTPVLYFRISEVIVRKAGQLLKSELNMQVLISLTDHIYYAVERKKKNICVPNFMLNEIKALYKKEFKIGLWALKLIEANTSVALDEDEAGYIAMYVANATLGIEKKDTQISKILRFIKDIQRVVENVYEISLNEKDLDYSRFITHLKFLGQHLFSKEEKKVENLGDIYSFLMKHNERMEVCIKEISEMLIETYHYTLEEYEQVYLMIHISKLIS